MGVQCRRRQRIPDADTDTGLLRRLYRRFHAGCPGRHTLTHAVMAVDLRHVGLLGQFLHGPETAPHQPGRVVHLHWRLECAVGALRAVGTVRFGAPDPRWKLQRIRPLMGKYTPVIP